MGDSFVMVNGIKFFGQKGIRVSVEEIQAIVPTIDSEGYLLKHFSALPLSERELLLGKKITLRGAEVVITDQFINEQLAAAGSCFDGRVLTLASPRLLLAFVKRRLLKLVEEREYHWIQREYCEDCTASLIVTDAIKMEEGIPLDRPIGVASVVEITPEIADKVFTDQRGAHDQYAVKKIRGIPKPRLNTLIIALRWYSNQPAPQFLTVYVGRVAPPFPDPARQKLEEVAYNMEFWNNHCFIVD